MQAAAQPSIPLDDRALFRSLCEMIVPRTLLANKLPPEGGLEGYHHSSCQPWEDAFQLLMAIEVLRLDAQGLHQMRIPDDRLGGHIGQLDLQETHLLELALSVFVGIFGLHDDLPQTRYPFELPTKYDKVSVELEAAGYLSRAARLCQWTEKISPAMVENSIWSSSGICFDDQFQAEVSTLAERILTHMPGAMRAGLAGLSQTGSLECLLFSNGKLGGWLDKARDPKLASMHFPPNWRKAIIVQLALKRGAS